MQAKEQKQRTLKSFFTAPDIVAAVACIALAFIMFLCARRAGNYADETFYYTIPQRMLLGDRLLIDEWHLTQLSAFFQIFPYWLYTRINGSNEGILLFMQCVYIGTNSALFLFFYCKMKKIGRPWLGIISSFLFCSDAVLGLMHLNYYNMGVQSIAVVCFLLFVNDKEPSPLSYIFTGFVFACSVLTQPGYLLIYAAYCLAVLLRITAFRKKSLHKLYDRLLNGKTWLFISVGCGICAVPVLIYVLTCGGFTEIIRNLPGLLSAGDYNMNPGYRIPYYLERVFTLCFLSEYGVFTVFVLIFLLYKLVRSSKTLKRKRSHYLSVEWIPDLFLIVGLVLFIGYSAIAYIELDPVLFIRTGLINIFYEDGSSVGSLIIEALDRTHLEAPLAIICICVIALSAAKKRDERFLLFLPVCVLASVGADFTSEFNVGYGGRMLYFPAIVFIADRIEAGSFPAFAALQKNNITFSAAASETADRREKKRNNSLQKKLLIITITCLSLLCVLARGLQNAQQFGLQSLLSRNNDTIEIDFGAYKGRHLSRSFYGRISQVQNDIVQIRQSCKSAVCVFGNLGYEYFYLQLGLPFGVYSTYIHEDDSLYRFAEYWLLHPNKRPDIIFVPETNEDYVMTPETVVSAKKNIRLLSLLCDYDTTKLKTGYMLRVTNWKLADVDLEALKDMRLSRENQQ